MKKKWIISAVAGAALPLLASVASAASVTGAFTTGQQQWSDDSAEILIDNDFSGGITVGDYFVGVIGITSFPTTGVDASSVNELTSIFAAEVTSVEALNPLACNSDATAITSCSLFGFGATGDFNGALAAASAFLDATTGETLNITSYDNVTADSIAVWLEDDGTLFNRDNGSQANAFNTAGDGTERLVVDLIADNGDGWTGTGPAILGDFFNVDSGAGVGNFNINGTIVYQDFAGLEFDPNITASGNLKPTSVSNFIVTDDATFEVFISVPAPGSVALLSLGLLGLGFSVRRKQKA